MVDTRRSRNEEPAPEFILRVHSAQINHLTFSNDGQFLISSDADGFIAVWSLATYRPLLFWKAHNASVLCTEAWGNKFITHGRDNLLHVFLFPEMHAPVTAAGTTSTPSSSNLSHVQALHSLQVSSLSFCKCALYKANQDEALVAVPSITKDEEVDIFHLPSLKRVSRAIGTAAWSINDKTGTVMALALYREADQIVLFAAYEDGRLAIFHLDEPKQLEDIRSGEGEGWKMIWFGKGHSEPIMAMTLSPDYLTAWTASADRYIVQWQIGKISENSAEEDVIVKFATRSVGRSALALRQDSKILAAAGWDGVWVIIRRSSAVSLIAARSLTRVQILSVKSGKIVALLNFHRDSVYAVAFCTPPSGTDGDSSSQMTAEKRAWLATAGKDQRIALWDIFN